jgi:diguanylate cyclase (GGDEF)-like protein/PAS domain S-box-containing protein
MNAAFDPGSYSFSVYSLPVLIVGGGAAVLAISMSIRERASAVSLAYLAMTWSASAWLLAFAAIYSTNDPSAALFWVKVEHAGVVSIPTTLFLFSAAVTGQLRRMSPVVLLGALLSTAFFVGVISTGWFVVGIDHHYWGYYPIYGWPVVGILVFFGGMFSASLQLFRAALAQAGPESRRQRLRGIYVALTIAYGGSIDYLPALHVPVYPFGYVFIGACMVLITRAVWRYRLVDITPAFAANEIVETMADALLVLDREGVVRVANEAATEMLWSPKQELIGMPAAILDATWFDGALGGLAKPLQHAEVKFSRPDGEERTALISVSMVRDGAGQRQATVWIAHDITERTQAEEAVRKSEALYRTLVETSPDAVLVAERDGRVLMANRRAAELVGLTSADEVCGRNALEFVTTDDQQRLREGFEQASGSVVIRDMEYTLVKSDGGTLPAELSVSRVPGAAGEFTAIMAVARDISERKRAEETIRYLAFHDALTGVATRSVLVDRLTQAAAQARRDGSKVALLFLDLDGFKKVNDTAGHTTGDAVLRSIASELGGLLREGDTLARMGGDEFVVLLPRISGGEEAVRVAVRVLQRLRQRRRAGEREFSVTGSVGIAIHPDDGDGPEALLRSADLAMYAAKARGGDAYELFADLDRNIQARLPVT